MKSKITLMRKCKDIVSWDGRCQYTMSMFYERTQKILHQAQRVSANVARMSIAK